MPNGRAILVDAGPLVALADRSDSHHARCVEALKQMRGPLLTAWPVLTEAMHLLSFSLIAQDTLWEALQRETLHVAALGAQDIPRLRALMRKYRDQPMDLADASLVRLAEREHLRIVFTLDHRDFRVYRPPHGEHFTLIPHSLT